MRKFFEPGNTAAVGHGRPVGAKDKVARLVWQEVLEFLTEPATQCCVNPTKLRAALELAHREGELLKYLFQNMPQEFLVSNITSLEDGELDRMIEMMQQRALELRAEREMKLVEHR